MPLKTMECKQLINRSENYGSLKVLTECKNGQDVEKPKKNRKWTMKEGDEFMGYKWVEDGDRKKRKRIIKHKRTGKVKLTKE